MNIIFSINLSCSWRCLRQPAHSTSPFWCQCKGGLNITYGWRAMPHTIYLVRRRCCALYVDYNTHLQIFSANPSQPKRLPKGVVVHYSVSHYLVMLTSTDKHSAVVTGWLLFPRHSQSRSPCQSVAAFGIAVKISTHLHRVRRWIPFHAFCMFCFYEWYVLKLINHSYMCGENS